jgi:hypothetical protein
VVARRGVVPLRLRDGAEGVEDLRAIRLLRERAERGARRVRLADQRLEAGQVEARLLVARLLLHAGSKDPGGLERPVAVELRQPPEEEHAMGVAPLGVGAHLGVAAQQEERGGPARGLRRLDRSGHGAGRVDQGSQRAPHADLGRGAAAQLQRLPHVGQGAVQGTVDVDGEVGDHGTLLGRAPGQEAIKILTARRPSNLRGHRLGPSP